MVENEPGFSRDMTQVECVIHGEKQIDIVRLGLRTHERAENDEPLQVARCGRQFVNSPEAHSDQLALNRGFTKLVQDLLQ